MSELSIPVRCALIAVAASALAAGHALESAGWHPSGLVRMAAEEPMAAVAREADPEFRFVDIGAHYDGVYFYAIALDPFARGTEHTLIDKSAYRYGHAGYGWMAGIVSLGRASAVPAALLLLGVAGLAVAAWAIAHLSEASGWSPWAGLAVALNPGLLYSLTALTSETVAAGLLAVTLLLWVRGRYVPSAICLTALILVKEPFVLVAAGLGIWEVTRWLQTRDVTTLYRRIALLATGPLVFGVWYVYLKGTFGEWPFEATEGFFALPLMGWLESMRQTSDAARGDFLTSQIGAASAPLLVAAAVALLVGIYKATRLRTPVDPVFLLLTLLALCLRPLGVAYPKDLIREISMPLLLLPLMLFTTRVEENREPD